MFKKMAVCAVLAALLAGGVSFAAEQDKGKARQGRVQKNRPQRADLVGQLIRAYNAGDRQKVGNIIGQMEQRRARARSAENPRQGSRKAGAGRRAGGGQKPLGGGKMQKGQRPGRGSGRLQRGFAEPGPARQAAGAAAGARKRETIDVERRVGWRRGAMAGRMARQGGRGGRATGMRRWQGRGQRRGAMGMRRWPCMRQRRGAMGMREWRGRGQGRGAMGIRRWRGRGQGRGAMGIRRWRGRGPGQRRMWQQGRGDRDNSAFGGPRIPEARFDWD